MAQYQSFPEVPGDSHTLDKLKALKLPDLHGRSFLDVGCNEGFFCGFAGFQGARRVVGIDHSAGFIERARRRFPACEFLCSDWTHLPDERFDVILLASSLHYAEDQAAMVRKLVDMLAPDGVLVLEIGIASSPKAEWTRVKRGIDERYFPSMPQLREVLSDYAWKWMGKSVPQAGDPIGRHVIHVSRRRPAAYLLMQPPGYGKSSIARRLFLPSGVQVVSGDELISEIAEGKREASAKLSECLARDYSPFHIDKTIHRAFDAGLADELVMLWTSVAGDGDFALDAYVPAGHQEQVENELLRHGYLPITLRWEKVGPRTGASESLANQAEAFYFALAGTAVLDAQPRDGGRDAVGFVDEVTLVDGRLVVRGWAVSSQGQLPARMHVQIGARTVIVERFDKQSRPDVQRHLGLPHALVGYCFEIEVPEASSLAAVADGFEVYDPAGASFRLAGPVAKVFADAG
jgi:SAM-dependent methyltransferase